MRAVSGNVHNHSVDGWQQPSFPPARAGRISWERRRLAGEFRFYHCFSNTRISFLINAMTRCLAR